MDTKKLKSRLKRFVHNPFRFLYEITDKVFAEVLFHPRQMIISHLQRTEKVHNNRVVFSTITDTYSCNPKYIYEELNRRGGFDLIWLSSRKKRHTFPQRVRVMDRFSISGLKAAASARLLIDNGVVFSNYYEKKEGQIHLQTMHGSLGIKKLDNAIKLREQKGKKGRDVIRRESDGTDYVITNSRFEEEVFRTAFWSRTPMLRLGHPRTDILFSQNTGKTDEIRKRLWSDYQIPKKNKIILYGPTYRLGVSAESLITDFDLLTEAAKERFKGDFSVLLRLHPNTRDVFFRALSPNVYDVTDYPDIQELMLVTDIGITDYSSWIFDYVLMRRPGFLFASDKTAYMKVTGLCYLPEESPFPVSEDFETLIKRIRSFDEKAYIQRVEAFLTDKECVDDGLSACRAADLITKLTTTVQ